MKMNLTVLPWPLFDRILDIVESGRGDFLSKLEGIREVDLAVCTIRMIIKPRILRWFDDLQLHYGGGEMRGVYYWRLSSSIPVNNVKPIPDALKTMIGLEKCNDEYVAKYFMENRSLYYVFKDLEIAIECNQDNCLMIRINNYHKDYKF